MFSQALSNRRDKVWVPRYNDLFIRLHVKWFHLRCKMFHVLLQICLCLTIFGLRVTLHRVYTVIYINEALTHYWLLYNQIWVDIQTSNASNLKLESTITPTKTQSVEAYQDTGWTMRRKCSHVLLSLHVYECHSEHTNLNDFSLNSVCLSP